MVIMLSSIQGYANSELDTVTLAWNLKESAIQELLTDVQQHLKQLHQVIMIRYRFKKIQEDMDWCGNKIQPVLSFLSIEKPYSEISTYRYYLYCILLWSLIHLQPFWTFSCTIEMLLAYQSEIKLFQTKPSHALL